MQFKAIIHAVNTMNSILKDKQIDNLHDELESIRLALIDKDHEINNEDLEQSERVELVLDELEEVIDNA